MIKKTKMETHFNRCLSFGKFRNGQNPHRRGANLDIQNNNRDTALMSAAFFCNKEVVKLLLDAGADKSLRNASGATVTEFMSAPWNDEMEGLPNLLEAFYKWI